MSYAFGDSALAAERLALVAQVFDGPSRTFWRAFAPRAPGLALDLGCGPGHTTHALAQSVDATQTVGVDASAEFLGAAQRTARPGVRFLRHDVTVLPLPLDPAELVVCRFLLSHLREPTRVVASWAALLAPGGRLLVEEVESISTDCPVFGRYLALVAATLDGQGQELYVGPILDRAGVPAGLERLASRVAFHRVATVDAARMFGMNLPALGRNPIAQAREGERGLAELAHELRALALSPSGPFENRWGLRQLAFQPAAGTDSDGVAKR
ncbi:MAG TPA: class I SAM-dependent methyltransferase [Myxococcota bacterium]|nr:class I SAM-dependent methyltransferase [Myxococcota bacterium]